MQQKNYHLLAQLITTVHTWFIWRWGGLMNLLMVCQYNKSILKLIGFQLSYYISAAHGMMMFKFSKRLLHKKLLL